MFSVRALMCPSHLRTEQRSQTQCWRDRGVNDLYGEVLMILRLTALRGDAMHSHVTKRDPNIYVILQRDQRTEKP